MAAGFVFLAVATAAYVWKVHFIDVGTASGLTVQNTYGGRAHKDYILETTGNGVAIFDFDGDGYNDIFIANGAMLDGSSRGAHAQLYRNDGTGHFTEISGMAGLTQAGWAQGVCVGDYDNDGRPDLFVTYFGHNILYHNEGNGKFTDVTRAAGLPVEGTRWGSGCTFVDYDRDGKLDIFVANYVDLDLSKTPKPGENPNCFWKGVPVMCGPQGLPPAHNALYHNNGDGAFTDVSEKAGILKPGGRYGLAVVAADFDNDGWPDLYVACDMMPSLLFRNRGDGTFEERGVEAGVAYNFNGALQAGMGAAVADFAGDGFLGILKSNFSGDLPSLYRNEDGKFFTDVAQQAGLGVNQLLGWGVAFLDVDEDGWKDIILANGHVYPEVERVETGEKYLQRTLVYRNLGNGRFEDITARAGPAFEQSRPARGLAVGDLDGDGRPEIVIVNMNQTPSLLKNTAPRRNFLSILLVGTRSNRSAIGARVDIEADGRRQIDEVMGGSSFYSQNDPALFFGLGNADTVDRIGVRWPSGALQEWKHVAANRKIVLTEGNSSIGTAR